MNLRFLLFSFFVLSCSSLQPRPENAIGVVKSVFDKDEEKQGELFLQDDGLWAYVGDKVSGDISLGTLLFYGASETSHSFAVVETNAWGLLLQRLDSESLAASKNEDFIISDMSVKDQQTWSICTTEKCLLDYRPGVVFHLYAQDNGLLTPSKDKGFARTGIARISNGEVIVDGLLPKTFLAVASTSRDFPTKGRIANEGCSIVNKDTNSFLELSFPKAQTPVDISILSVEKSVDGFIRCHDSETSIAIPGLWRAHHPMLFGTFSIAPIISSQVYNFPTPSPLGLEQLTKFMIAVGTGDFAAADFWLDSFSDTHPGKAYRLFLKNASEISTAANRPENAIRLLKLAMTGHWNPENDARWNAVRYRIEKMVGTPRNAILRYSKLPEFFEKEEDPIVDFLTFFSLRQERSQNREIGKPKYIGDKEKWTLATLVDRNLEFVGKEKPETLTPDTIAALAMFEKITKNSFDIFGRTPPGYLSTKDILVRGKSQFLVGLPATTKFSPTMGDGKQAYFFDSLSSTQKNKLLSRLIGTPDEEACKTAGSNDIYSQLELRLSEGFAENELLLWYVDAGIINKCKSDLAFIESATRSQLDTKVVGPSILRGVLSRDEIEYKTAKQVSKFALRDARGLSCETFHTGFAFALLKHDRFTEALNQLNNASKCIDSPSEDLTTLLAFALFERTGEIEGTPLIQKKLMEAVRATKNECPGNKPLDYQLDFLVSDSTRSLSKKFSFDNVENKTIQFEQTGNAVNDGRRSILAANASLTAGDFKSAVLSLQGAQKSFETANFYPGLHRVRFLKMKLTQKTKKKESEARPTKIAKSFLEKKTLEDNNTNTILIKILKGEDLRNLKHPDLCSPLIIPTQKLVID